MSVNSVTEQEQKCISKKNNKPASAEQDNYVDCQKYQDFRLLKNKKNV